MSLVTHSAVFNPNLFLWKIFGIWAGRAPSKYYKYYSFLYIFITLFVYNILLTLNLIYTPRKIEFLIREVIFYFTEITVTSKVLMVLLMRNKIIDALNLLDCVEFRGNDERSTSTVEKYNAIYIRCWQLYNVLSNISYSSQVFGSVFVYMIWETKLELPICKYYFLSEELQQSYFLYWFIYQSLGMYGHMMYNVNIDSFIAGLLLTAITQLKVLKAKFNSFKLETSINTHNIEIEDRIQVLRLNECLKHYDLVLTYCSTIQDLLNVTMFVQFGIAAAIICVVMCGLILPSKTETLIFLVMYLFLMMLQIFVPGWLGTQLSYESQELTVAAYNSEWIPRSKPFKKSLRLFMQRCNIPIRMTGLTMFPLSLDTFTSIMKTAYSLFTLIRSVQDRQNVEN